MEVLAVDRDSAHSWNCPHSLPPESEQVGDHDQSCHGVKRSDHDERWHDEKLSDPDEKHHDEKYVQCDEKPNDE